MADGVAGAAALVILDKLPYAFVVVDERARVLVENAMAREVISRGQVLRRDGDVLCAVSADDDRELKSAIGVATSGSTSSWLTNAGALRVGSNHAQIPILVLPVRAAVDPLLGRRGLAFVIFGGDAPMPHRGLLAGMYRFTEREADLACALIEGQDLAHAARALRISIHTARTHLRHLMDKTDTGRQGDLVRVLLGSIPPHT